MRRFLIDTDTASDDAVALVMALNHPEVRVEAITVVGGNVPLEQGVQNALYTVHLCNSDVPVHAGRDRPLLRPLQTAQFCHGQDGFGDIGLPLRGRRPASHEAVDVIKRMAKAYAGELTLVTLGPLTNIAAALLSDPHLPGRIERCVVMGGIGLGHGNVVPAAEYNVWVDPEAAQIVFNAGLPLTMVGWDVSQKFATFNDEEAARLHDWSPLGAFCIDIQAQMRSFGTNKLKLDGFDLPDPIAMAVALDPHVATDTRHLHVDVETHSELTRGATVVDHLGMTEQAPNTHVVLEASREAFLRLLYDAVSVD